MIIEFYLINICKEFASQVCVIAVYSLHPKVPFTPKDSKDSKASKAPRWEPGLTEECEMKNGAAGEDVAVAQARRSNL